MISLVRKLSPALLAGAFLVACNACGGATPNVDASVPVASAAPTPPVDPQLAQVTGASIRLPDGWKRQPLPKTGGVELLATSPDGSAHLMVRTVPHTGTPIEFIQAQAEAIDASENIKVVNGGRVTLESGQKGIFLVELRKTDNGGVDGVGELLVASTSTGYSVICGGDIQSAESWKHECSETFATFAIK